MKELAAVDSTLEVFDVVFLERERIKGFVG